MLIGDLDLERAFRDPGYRRRVTAFIADEMPPEETGERPEDRSHGAASRRPALPPPSPRTAPREGAD